MTDQFFRIEYELLTGGDYRWAWRLIVNEEDIAVSGKLYESQLEAAHGLLDMLQGKYAAPDCMASIYTLIGQLTPQGSTAENVVPFERTAPTP